ncbi:ankyrin repeat and SOCS box protein 10 isoform X2 [Protopterus annectens]|uniref:ankyrin repeat and SOCS box protein 10 isoform X2 n=1 Tax=Protopterus annectens TaxID=7888 RepID=UPI001CF974E7|nr:ankyrin repeat and SOCS box protein 10 isoform X2 [Protopterus annectens]
MANRPKKSKLSRQVMNSKYTDAILTRKAQGSSLRFWNALMDDDKETVTSLLDHESTLTPNTIFDTSDVDEWKNYGSNFRRLRLWSLSYEQELTTPLHITASRGYNDCLRHLLLRGAEVDLAPGGKTPLHEACENAMTESVRLLLAFGACTNAISEDGLSPLHYCNSTESLECAKLVLTYGANVNCQSEEEEDTPLHIAAQNGLEEHLKLYLQYGADVHKKNNEGLTPLNTACAQPHRAEDTDRYYHMCKELVDRGAKVTVCDLDRVSPLHNACKVANHKVVELLLEQGARVNDMNYSGNTPLHNILQVVPFKLEHYPERTVRALLNYGAIRLWPGSIPKVLQVCSPSPRTIEVLINCYDRLKDTTGWEESVPFTVLVKYPEFYESLFTLSSKPRSLQHLARHVVRTYLDGRLRKVIPKLRLPPIFEKYLMLAFEDYLY